MSRVPGGAAAAANPTSESRVSARVVGILTRPRATFAGLRAAPRWAAVLTLSTAVAAMASAAFYSTDVGRLALVDQWERTAFTFGVDLDDGTYASLLELSEYGGIYGVAHAVAGVAVLSIAVAVAAFTLLRRRNRGPAFRHVLAVMAHASVILALRTVMAAPIGYARERASGALSLADWMPIIERGSSASRLLGTVDLFFLWWAAVAAVGMAGLYDTPARRMVPVFVGVYVGFVLLLAGATLALGPR